VFYATAQVVGRAVTIFAAEGCVHIPKHDSVRMLQRVRVAEEQHCQLDFAHRLLCTAISNPLQNSASSTAVL
jgi:hypothetical protein